MNEYDLLEHIAKLTRAVRRRAKPQVPRAGFKLLRSVMEKDGIRTAELADLLDIRPSSLTDGLDRLEAEGYIERRKNPDDMRMVQVYLTQKSRDDFDIIHRENEEYSGKLAACLSEEERIRFCETCDKLAACMEQEYGQDEERHHHQHRHAWGGKP